MTALMLAASKGHEAAMKVLLQAGADLTVQDQVSE
jgi:ankyrin repeat protein